MNSLTKFHNGKIELKLPTLTFNNKLVLEDEGVEFIYAPGHTIDSSLCFDRKDSVLFVGDLVEFPIPYLDYYDLDAFIQTLQLIKHFPANYKLSAHSGLVNPDLIERNLLYVEDIKLQKPISSEMIGSALEVHQYNLNNCILLKYEPHIREKLGTNFNYSLYKSNFMDLGQIKTEDLISALEKYLSRL